MTDHPLNPDGTYVEAPHFRPVEMMCPTSGQARFQPGFLALLESLRVLCDVPFQINSACRSNEHNEWLLSRGYPASPNSWHLMGKQLGDGSRSDTIAVDVACTDSHLRHIIVQVALDRGWTVGVAKTFLHLDARYQLFHDDPICYVY